MATERRRHIAESGTAWLLYVAFGPIVWALHLTFIYGVVTLICARQIAAVVFGISAAPFFVVAATIFALVALAAAIYWPRRLRRRASSQPEQQRRFRDRVMVILAVLSAIGVAWAGAAALLVAPCG